LTFYTQELIPPKLLEVIVQQSVLSLE